MPPCWCRSAPITCNRFRVSALLLTEEALMPRELIDTGTDKRYVRRDKKGQFKESDDQGKSLAQDRRTASKRAVKKGEGDRGDQKRKS